MLPAVAYHGLTLSSYKEATLERTEFKTGKHHYRWEKNSVRKLSDHTSDV